MHVLSIPALVPTCVPILVQYSDILHSFLALLSASVPTSVSFLFSVDLLTPVPIVCGVLLRDGDQVSRPIVGYVISRSTASSRLRYLSTIARNLRLPYRMHQSTSTLQVPDTRNSRLS